MNTFYKATRAIYAHNVAQLGTLCSPEFIASDTDFAFLLLIAIRAGSRDCVKYLTSLRKQFVIALPIQFTDIFAKVLQILRDRDGDTIARDIAKYCAIDYSRLSSHSTWKYIMHHQLCDTLYFPSNMDIQDTLYCAKYIGKYGTIANACSLILIFPVSTGCSTALRIRLQIIVRVIVNALAKGSQPINNRYIGNDSQSTDLARIQFAHNIEHMFRHDLIGMVQIIACDKFIPYAPTDIRRATICANLYQAHIVSTNPWAERAIIAQLARENGAQYLAQCMTPFSRENSVISTIFDKLQLYEFTNIACHSYIVKTYNRSLSNIVDGRGYCTKTQIIAQCLRAYYTACYSRKDAEYYCQFTPRLTIDWNNMIQHIFAHFAKGDILLCTDDMTCELDMSQIRAICPFTYTGQGVAIRTIHQLELTS